MKFIFIAIAMVIAFVSSASAATVYDSNGRPFAQTARNADGSWTTSNTGRRTVERGNKSCTWEANGQLAYCGVLRGNEMRHYAPGGRYLGRSVKRGAFVYHYGPSGNFYGTSR